MDRVFSGRDIVRLALLYFNIGDVEVVEQVLKGGRALLVRVHRLRLVLKVNAVGGGLRGALAGVAFVAALGRDIIGASFAGFFKVAFARFEFRRLVRSRYLFSLSRLGILLFRRCSVGDLAPLDQFVVSVRKQAPVAILAVALLAEVLTHLVLEPDVCLGWISGRALVRCIG